MFRLRTTFLVAATLAASAPAFAQTYLWGGGYPNGEYSVGTNWYGGSPPPNDGSAFIAFNGDSDGNLNLDVAASVLGVQVTSTSGNGIGENIFGKGPLTIGAGGVALSTDGTTNTFLDLSVPVMLGASQTWSQLDNAFGTLQADGPIAGAFGLTLTGGTTFATFTLNSGASTFSGGVTVTSTNTYAFDGESPYQTTILTVGSSSTGPAGSPTSGPLGTGTLTLGDGTTLTTTTSNLITIANPVTAGDNSTGLPITFGGPISQYSGTGYWGNLLTLTGPVTLADPDIEFDVGGNSWVTFAGPVAGASSGYCLDVGSTSLPNAVAVFQGAISNVARLDLGDSVSVILDGAGMSQISGLEDIGFEDSAYNTYLGLGSGYSSAGGVTAFLAFMHSSESDSGFQGTLGFDTTSGSPATFDDPVDLTNFTSPSFVGLGSATSAILGPDAVITPPGGNNSSGTFYSFGGGGGTLMVQSALTDGNLLYNPDSEQYNLPNPRSLVLNSGNAPLTLVLSGPLSYSGGTLNYGGVLIFDTPLPSRGSLNLQSGYIGSTVNSGLTDDNDNIQGFINRFNDAEAFGVIGFDALDGTTRVVSSSINLPASDGDLYLGTSTSVDYTGSITPDGSEFLFAGVKGGQVTISSNLTGEAGVYIGLPNNLIEAFNTSTGAMTQSSVTLAGENSYSLPTYLQSGYLFVTNNESLSDPALIVPDSWDYLQWGQTLAVSGDPVTLANNIRVPSTGLALNTGSSEMLTLTGTISDYGDDQGSIGIFGPVTLMGANSYSGGTTVNGASLVVANDFALGSGELQAYGSSLDFTSSSPVVTGFRLQNSTATFDGSPNLSYVMLQGNSVINLNGGSALFYGLKDDNSANQINMADGTQLEVVVQTDQQNNSSFHGTINGGGSLVVTGGGGFELRGANTYTGGTMIDSGSVVIASNNSALGTGGVVVGGALGTNLGVTLSNPISLQPGGALAGFGTFSPGGTLTFAGGSVLNPGSATLVTGGSSISQVPVPGALGIGANTNVVFGSGGYFIVSVTDAAGAAGVGYGTANLGGSLSFNVDDPFVIALASFDPSLQTLGNANNFNPNQSYSWTFLTAAGGITGFNASSFYLDTSLFSNPTGIGSFYVAEQGDALTLNFTPVPEPSTWITMASGVLALGAAARRRRR
jgi:autotransporter-associated beta strand protein